MPTKCESVPNDPTPVAWGPLPTPIVEIGSYPFQTPVVHHQPSECPPFSESNHRQNDIYALWMLYLALGGVVAYRTVRNLSIRSKSVAKI